MGNVLALVRRAVPRGGWWIAGLLAALIWYAGREADIPALTLVMDGFGFESDWTTEDSAALQRLDTGEGLVRYRMLVCGEVLVDEVVSSWEDIDQWWPRGTHYKPVLVEEFLADLKAADPDSLIADWADWGAMEQLNPTERDQWNAELGRLKSLLLHSDALDTISSKTLGELLPMLREAECESQLADLEWRLNRS